MQPPGMCSALIWILIIETKESPVLKFLTISSSILPFIWTTPVVKNESPFSTLTVKVHVASGGRVMSPVMELGDERVPVRDCRG